jgi:hypothetical protein
MNKMKDIVYISVILLLTSLFFIKSKGPVTYMTDINDCAGVYYPEFTGYKIPSTISNKDHILYVDPNQYNYTTGTNSVSISDTEYNMLKIKNITKMDNGFYSINNGYIRIKPGKVLILRDAIVMTNDPSYLKSYNTWEDEDGEVYYDDSNKFLKRRTYEKCPG